MRIHLKLTPNNEPVPFNYQENLTGAVNKWMGDNPGHDKISLYSFSWLNKGRPVKNKTGIKHLNFESGTGFFISAWDEATIKQIIEGIQKDPEIAFGLKVHEIIIQETPDFTKRVYFEAASPIFIKRKIEDRIKFYYHNNKEAGTLLTETLKNKMKIAGIEDDSLEIQFDENYSQAYKKGTKYNGIQNIGSICPVIIKARPETKAFAWNVGLGNSTGIGFGAIR